MLRVPAQEEHGLDGRDSGVGAFGLPQVGVKDFKGVPGSHQVSIGGALEANNGEDEG